MDEDRWTTVTESSFDHERHGLEQIRAKLPNVDPWFAWSNFTFTAQTGHVREVDLLIVSPSGVFMIELKHWSGRVTWENGTWVQYLPHGGRRFHRNPVHLVNQKAKELGGLLRSNGAKAFVDHAVCLTNPEVRFELPPGDRTNTHTVAELVRRLTTPARDARDRIDIHRAQEIRKALDKVGIRRSDAEFTVGPYHLERKPFDAGPTWQDYLADHNQLRERVRIRIYLRERGADPELRKSVDEAARREAAVLDRFHHPGAVQLTMFDPSAHSAGPALIFRYHPDTLHLDDYLTRYGALLDITDRMALVRQLAETLQSAHSRRIHHRALASRSIHVVPRSGESEEQRWRTPLLQISDWHVATHRSTGATSTATRHATTSLSAHHLAAGSDAYLAPELSASRPDPIALDVYGLGMLTFLITTGKAPAATQAELLARFEAGESLRPGALVDGLPDDLDLLVAAATDFKPSLRLTSMDEFLELLDDVDEALRAPVESSHPEPDKDPLDAVAGDVLADRWQVQRRLGTGSTSRALLVRDLHADPTKRGAHPFAVLKVALSEDRGELLVKEAEVLGRLRPHSGVITLLDPGVVRIGGRTTLVLEYVGDEQGAAEPDADGKRRRTEETVARQLRDTGRIPLDQLESYSDYLFGAVDFLEGEGVWHRDIKPDNIAIRVRPNRTRELVLIDFSLSWYPATRADAGTDGYLDPFMGSAVLTRSSYDSHAERYALAVTLHEMASGELPKWGDGSVLPRQLDAAQWPYPEIAADAFDPAIRDGLVAFFRKALHRDAARRFPDLKPMRDEWRKIFLALTRAVPSRVPSRHPEADSQSSPAAERELAAEQVTRETHLSAAGLTPAAEQFLYGLGVNTVGELLDFGRHGLITAPGLGARTRREIQQRQKEWGRRLGKTAPAPLTPEARKEAKDESASPTADTATLSLDGLVARFVPERNNNGSNTTKVGAVARLLRIPGDGDLPELETWPTQSAVARTLGLTPARVAQLLREERKRWKKDPAVQALRTQVLELLSEFGRVASADELADALTASRGTRLDDRRARRALGLAAVRVLVEVEQLAPEEAAFLHAVRRPKTDKGADPVVLLALEAGEDADRNTPSAPALLQYAQDLGRVADDLADHDTLPTAATALERLGAVTRPVGELHWDERRLVHVAVAASHTAAATPRLEVYSRALPLVRAIRLTQAGLVRITPGLRIGLQPGLTTEQIHERIRARFPDLTLDRDRGLPAGEVLTKALRDAGFPLHLATRENTGKVRYLPDHADDPSSYSLVSLRHATDLDRPHLSRYSTDPEVAAAARADDSLTTAAERDGFRVLTVEPRHLWPTRESLTRRFSARPLSVTELFLAAMHALIPPNTKPTWQTILRADTAEPGSKAAIKFSEYARTAWSGVELQLTAHLPGDGPLLLTDTHVFARYDAMGVLNRLADQARRGQGAVWLLCPQPDALREPRLGTVAVPYQASLHEWITLPPSWTRNLHRGSRPRQADDDQATA